MRLEAIPILRIFDEVKAKEFYLGFLSMSLDWEHRFSGDDHIYMQVSKGDLKLHLSEHSADCSPGAKVFVNTNSLDALYHEVTATNYKYSRPEIIQAPWGDRVFEVVDPFSNKIIFNESLNN